MRRNLWSPRPARSPHRRPWWIPLGLALIGVSVLFVLNRRQAQTLTYRIGAVDPRFGLTQAEFAGAARQAASLWNEALARPLFREAPDGSVEIALVYDYRQESADRLKALSLRIDGTKGDYESLKAHFETLKAEAEQKGAALTQDFAEYNAQVGRFNARSEDARRTPVSEDDRRRMEAERSALAEVKAGLMRRQDEMKGMVETLNSFTVVINGIAANHNLDLVDYNRAGDRLGPEFSEGEYVQKGSQRTITVYHFPSRDALVRVLAHELGHAKGLHHLESPQAVMHRLMQTEVPELTSDDIAAMKAKAH